MDGLTVQVELAGAPVQVKVAVRVVGSFVAGLRRRGKTAFWPLWVVTVVLPSAVRAKSTPVPVSGRVWGEVGELSVMVRVPVRGPASRGGEGELQGAGGGDGEGGGAGVGSGDDGEVAGDGCGADGEGKATVVGEGDDG